MTRGLCLEISMRWLSWMIFASMAFIICRAEDSTLVAWRKESRRTSDGQIVSPELLKQARSSYSQNSQTIYPQQYYQPNPGSPRSSAFSIRQPSFLQTRLSRRPHGNIALDKKLVATRNAISKMLSPPLTQRKNREQGSMNHGEKNTITTPTFSNPKHQREEKDEMRFASSKQKEKAGASGDPWWVNPPPWWLPSPPEWGAPPPSVYSPFYSPGTIPNNFQAQAMPAYNPNPAPNYFWPQQQVCQPLRL